MMQACTAMLRVSALDAQKLQHHHIQNSSQTHLNTHQALKAGHEPSREELAMLTSMPDIDRKISSQINQSGAASGESKIHKR